MKLLKIIAILFVSSILLLLTIDLSMVAANEENVGYSVRAIIPENQIDQNHSYFDLQMKPNQKQEIQVEIYNSSIEDIEVEVHINNPTTNRNGLIDYTNIKADLDESLKIPVTEIASVKEMKVNVPAGKSQIATIQLEMPETEYDGIILGGIYFEKRMKEAEQKENGVQITNKYAYVIGLKVTETDTEVEPDLQLKSVQPDLVNYRTAIIANIQNAAPVIIENLAINAIVYNSKSEEVNRMDVEDYKIAPNSSMEFVIDWKNKELKPGTYTLTLHANSGIQNWEWEEKFVIQKETAKVLNEKAVKITKDNTYQIVSGFSFIILILLCVIFWLIRKNKQKSV